MSQGSESVPADEYSSADDESLRDISEYAPGISYSSTNTIEAIRSYHQFLVDMYLDKNDVEYPPEGGWPEITVENMRPLGKTEEVVQLLKHIPYVTWNGVGTPKANVAGDVHFHHWAMHARLAATSGWDVEGEKLMTEGAWDDEHIPASVIGLCHNESNGDHYLLDTALGLVYYSLGHYQEMRRHLLFKPLQALNTRAVDPAAYFPKNEVEWRDQPVWLIADFFEVLKHEFKVLNFVPVDNRRVLIAPQSYEGGYLDALIPTVRAVYREYGWPRSAEYDKGTCLSAVRSAIKDQHPEVYSYIYVYTY